MVFFEAGGWTSPPTIVATGFWKRWRGLRPQADGRGLLLCGSSVHGIGMKDALWIVGLDQEGAVEQVRLLRPNRFVTLPGATWLLEISATLPPPPIGSILHLSHTPSS